MPPHLLKPKGPVLPLRSAAATSSRYPSRNITSLAPAALSSAETEAAVAEAAVAVAAATPIGPGSVLLIHGELASGLKLEQGLILSEVIENGLQRMQNESYKVELRQNPFTSLMGVHLPPEMCQDLAGLYLQGCQRQDDGMLLLILGRRKKRMTLAQCLAIPAHQPMYLESLPSANNDSAASADGASGGKKRTLADVTRVGARRVPALATRSALLAGFKRVAESALRVVKELDADEAPVIQCTWAK